MKRLFLILAILIISTSAFASQPAGVVKSFEGKVLLYDGISPRGEAVTKVDTNLFVKNKVAVKRNAQAILSLISGDKIAMTSGSLMTIKDMEVFEPGVGKVIFHIKKRGKASGVKVGLKSSIIGVKGTKFLIETDENGKSNVYLKEGKIGVESTEGDFKKYGTPEIDEYEAYVRQMAGDYDEYMTELEEEAVEFLKSFDMEPGQAVSIDGNEVKDLEFTDEIDAQFELLDLID